MNNASPIGLPPQPDFGSEAPKQKNVMGKDDFMRLLMTQLQHQDPMNPMNHQEFITQLAQFSSLEQLSNIGSGIQTLRTGMGDEAKLQALGMIGRRVQTSGDEVELMQGQPVSLRHAAPDGVRPVKASVYDPNGKMIREIEIARIDETGEIKWDGKNNDGTDMPTGKYTFRIHGVGQNGQAQEIGTELSGKVTAVEISGKTPVLVVETSSGKQRIELAKIRNVAVDAEPTLAPLGKPGVMMAPRPPSSIPVAVAPQPIGSDDEAEPVEAPEPQVIEDMDEGEMAESSPLRDPFAGGRPLR